MSEEKKEKSLTVKSGKLDLQNTEDLKQVVGYLWASKLVSSSFKSQAEVFVGLQHAISLGLDPHDLQNMYVVNNRVQMWGSLPSKLIRKSGKLEWEKSYAINKDYVEISVDNKNLNDAVFAGVCETKRIDETEQRKTYFTVDDAKTAGLLGRDTYKKYLKNMLLQRARMENYTYAFSDVLGTTQLGEYHTNTRGDMLPASSVGEIKEVIGTASEEFQIKDASGTDTEVPKQEAVGANDFSEDEITV